jgi:hypothetical protein
LQQHAKWAALFTKFFLLVGFGAMLYYELFGKSNSAAIWETFHTRWRTHETGSWLLCVLLFVPLNWALETMKWLPMIRKMLPMSFFRGFEAVLAGVTFSLFTPNRVGEYGGRILFVPQSEAPRAIFANLVGNWAQQIMLYAFGFLGYIYFIKTFWQVPYVWLLLLVFGILFIGLFLFCFLNLELIVPLVKKIGWIRRQKWLKKNVGIVRTFTRDELYRVLIWSFLRYAVYVVQYFFMLRFFDIQVNFVAAMACIATIYLLQTALPLPPVVSLLARGEIALSIWGLFETDKMTILATTFCLWFINLILPALLGLVLILRSDVALIWFSGGKNQDKGD